MKPKVNRWSWTTSSRNYFPNETLIFLVKHLNFNHWDYSISVKLFFKIMTNVHTKYNLCLTTLILDRICLIGGDYHSIGMFKALNIFLIHWMRDGLVVSVLLQGIHHNRHWYPFTTIKIIRLGYIFKRLTNSFHVLWA